MAKVAAKIYGEALFQLALEENKLDTFMEEVAFVKEAFAENKDLIKLLNHPQISKEEKVKVIESIFKGRICDDVTGVLVLIVEKGRAFEIEGILSDFLTKVREYKKIGVAYVTSAVPLTEEQKQKIEQKLLATTDYVNYEMNFSVDASLIGGMVIRIGDRVVDSSIKTKLYHMAQNLSKVSLAEI